MGCFALDRKKISSESESLEISSSLFVLSCALVVKGKSRNNYSQAGVRYEMLDSQRNAFSS